MHQGDDFRTRKLTQLSEPPAGSARTEPDFIFYHKDDERITACGVFTDASPSPHSDDQPVLSRSARMRTKRTNPGGAGRRKPNVLPG